MPIVITISGSHGTGKSTYAKLLADHFSLRHISAGQLFREIAEAKGLSLEALTEVASKDPEIDRLIDARTKEEAEKGSVVIDGQLAGWMAGDKADLKIYLTAPERTRVKRIAERDAVTFKEAEGQTLARERMEKERFKRYYGMNLEDISIYDLVVDTALLPMEDTAKTLKAIVQDLVERS